MLKKTTYIIIFLSLQIFSAHVLGQSEKKIYGYVYDSKTDIPLVGANIIIDGTSIGTATNGSGYFQFNNILTGTYSITVSYIGYKKESIQNINVYIDQPTRVNIFLEEEYNLLKEVIVSSTDNYKTGSGIKVYRTEDIEKNNFQTVGELLQQTPGVEIQSTGGVGSSKKISIRGSETNQVLVLLDGIPLNNQFGGDADLSKIPTNIIEKIEIYEGGNSTKFGSGAIGGVINIITKQNFKNEYKLNLSGGSFEFYNIEPSISGNINNFSYFLSYNFLSSKGNYPYTYTNTFGDKANTDRLNADIKSENIFARINYTYDKYLFSINAQSLNSERGIPGKTNALTPYACVITDNKIVGGSIKTKFKTLVFELNGNYSTNETENSNLYPVDAPPEYTRYPRYHYKYETDITVINSTVYYKPIKWLNITAGYNGKWLNYNDEDLMAETAASLNEAQDISNGVFIHPEFSIELPKPFNNIIATPALRYDEISLSSQNLNRFENQWSPSASLYFSLFEKNKIYFKSSISRSFRVPTFSDLFYQDVRIEGKPDLLPEKSLNKEIGFGFEIDLCGKLKGEATFYNYTIDDMIVWKLGSFEIFRPYNNDAEITGQEYSLNYDISNTGLELGVSYTYLQPLDKNNNETTYNNIIPYRPQHSVKSFAQYQYKEFTTTVNYRFVGKRFVTSANTVELPEYNVLDFSMQQRFNVGLVNMILKFSATNILDEKYEIIRDYPVPGREFRIGISIIY